MIYLSFKLFEILIKVFIALFYKVEILVVHFSRPAFIWHICYILSRHVTSVFEGHIF